MTDFEEMARRVDTRPVIKSRFQAALDVQDACNMRAIARLLVEVCDEAFEETRNTSAVWSDPAVRLIVNKLESLAHSEANYSDAYAACKIRLMGKIPVTIEDGWENHPDR